MIYLLVVLSIIIFSLAASLFYLRLSIKKTIDQMEDIEIHPERNRQLKGITADSKYQELLNRINYIYQVRQKERIVYQKSETRIRREIENISHDLRTPLTSILGYLELIKDCQSEEEKAEFLDIIHKRAKVLQGFIQDFYELSRIEADDYPLLYDVCEVQTMLKETLAAYYYDFETKMIDVTVDLEEEPSYITADKIQFNRILNNLIQNALKYAKHSFTLRQFTAQGCCVLQFSNDTTIITKENMNLLFDRFYTGNQTGNSQNTGLGLTITKLLTEKMSGIIEARLEDQIFTVELRWLL